VKTRTTPALRPITLDDASAVISINAQGAPGVTPIDRADLDFVLGLATLAWVAVADGAVVAYVTAFDDEVQYDEDEINWCRAHAKRFLHIDQVAVAADWRGKGVGSAVYSAVESWAVSRGYRSITAGVNLEPPNPESMAFHHARGFVEFGRVWTKTKTHVALLQKAL